MSDSIKDIKHVCEEVVTLAKQSACSSQEVAASVEEMSAGFEVVFSIAFLLSETADDFKSHSSRFKVDA